MESSWTNNLWVIYNNSTNYFLIGTCVAVLTILVVYIWNDRGFSSKYKSKKATECKQESQRDNISDPNRTLVAGEGEEAIDGSIEKMAEQSLMSRIKTARHQYIVEQLTANMTEEQLMEEKKTERAQLEAIFKLLQEQQDKFQVASVDQLQDQLNLYR